ncbi:MAG: hypothetical protein LRY55_05105 [Leadbetterella sp.]|nr:hypothetical protein [Leadbetterella sp.]
MKNIICFVLFIFLFPGCKNSDAIPPQEEVVIYRYVVGDRKQVLIPVNDRIWIKTEASPGYFQQRYSEIKEFPENEAGLYGIYIEPSDDIFNLLDRLSLDPEVIYVGPFLVREDGLEFGGLTNKLLVRLKEGKSIEKALKNVEVQTCRQSEFDPSNYTITLKEKNGIKCLQIANELHENSGSFQYVDLNYLLIIRQGDRGIRVTGSGI